MKLSELRHLIKEELTKTLNENQHGLITLEQVKKCIEKNYIFNTIEDEEDRISLSKDLQEVTTVVELEETLIGWGYSRGEAYELIFSCILK